MPVVAAVERTWTTQESRQTICNALLDRIGILGGKGVIADDERIQADFGSLTQVALRVQHTHKLGWKMGYVGKYEEALRYVADVLQGTPIA